MNSGREKKKEKESGGYLEVFFRRLWLSVHARINSEWPHAFAMISTERNPAVYRCVSVFRLISAKQKHFKKKTPFQNQQRE
jgi:hypothetical protein